MSPKIAVLFGRPGAGKTTIAVQTLELYNLLCSKGQKVQSHHIECLDLDVCIPQWMKDNFTKGIYPTLEERNEFALTACDYVDKKVRNMAQADRVIVSFSFVNSDLRQIFRERFPNAKWFLVDTSMEEAQNRIEQRRNHFYVGAPKEAVTLKSEPNSIIDATDAGAIHSKEKHENDKKNFSNNSNSEWNFAPVDFEHVVLDGLVSVQTNSKKLLELILS